MSLDVLTRLCDTQTITSVRIVEGTDMLFSLHSQPP